jgi:hypothetical protein
VKFSCERCGKKYATADKPVPGRVYKLKCKACGHLIVVRPTAGGQAPAAPALAVAPPEVTLEIGAPESATPTPAPIAAAPPVPPLPRASEPTMQVSSAPAAGDDFQLKSGDTGYVDLFADGPPSDRANSPAPTADPFAVAAAAAAAASAPASPALDKDPFADVRAELAAVAAAEARPADASPPLATPKVPDIPRPPPQKQGSPVLLIGGGALVMLGIMVFALVKFGGQKAESAPTAAPTPVAAAPTPAPTPPPAAAEPVQPAATPPEPVAAAPEPKPEPKVAPPREVRREPKPEPKRRPEPKPAKPEPKPEPRVAQAPPPPPPREERNVDLPDVGEGLSQDVIQKVLASTRKAFDDCIVTAGKKSDVKLDGRKVVLRLNIQPNGTVTYPTLDDVQLNATPLGGCLKQAARLMVFPKFSGDPLRIEVPLVLNAR